MTGCTARSIGGRWRQLCLLFSLLLLVSLSGVYAQPVETSPSLSNDIATKLNKLSATFKALELAWEKQKLSFEQAQKQLATLRQQLQALRTALEQSQSELTISITSLQTLENSFEDLQRRFDDYQSTVNRKLLTTAILWLIIGIAAGGAAGIILE